MSKRSRRRKRKKGPKRYRFFSRRWFERAIVLMDEDGGFDYGDGYFHRIERSPVYVPPPDDPRGAHEADSRATHALMLAGCLLALALTIAAFWIASHR